MARGDHQIKIRFPDDLVETIRAAAKANGRSMNAEVVAQLLGRSSPNDETLRDKFAGQAIAPTVALLMAGLDIENIGWDDIAVRAYGLADAMLAARKAGA